MENKPLVNAIESYLKSLLSKSSDGWIEVRRKEIAELFDCVPSQITYVLNTRFSVRRGYLVESRRGGGGYVKIRSLFAAPEKLPEPDGAVEADDAAGGARSALLSLARQGAFTRREFLILSAVLEVLEEGLSGKRGGELFLRVLRRLAAEGFF